MSNVLLEGEYQGFAWKVAHDGYGYRHGFVRVPSGHPWYRVCPFRIPADVHGGLVYAAMDREGWWIGFDCRHMHDLPDPDLSGSEAMVKITDMLPSRTRDRMTVKSTEYVRRECIELCEQAIEAVET